MTSFEHSVELVTESDIGSRVAELGEAMSEDYAGRDPLFVVVMTGSVPFGESGRIGIAMDLSTPILDREVILVEDITDTGLTLSVLRRMMLDRGAASVATASLVDKKARRVTEVPIEYRGFEVGDEYLVGYGMDWQGLYRNLRSIWAVLDMEAFVNDPWVLARALGMVSGPVGQQPAGDNLRG